MMTITHKLATFTMLLASFVANSQPLSHTEDFKAAFKVVINRLEHSYKQGLQNKYRASKPFQTVLMSTNNQQVRNFYEKALNSPSKESNASLSVTFDANGKINGKKSALCLLRFVEEKSLSNLVSIESHLPKADIVYYLAAHEFGHCIEAHQRSLGIRINALTNQRNTKAYIGARELFADKFAIAFFMVNGKEKSANRVIEFNKVVNDDGVHRHYDELREFQAKLAPVIAKLDLKADIRSVLDVFDLANTF